jgi:hypothetical protein
MHYQRSDHSAFDPPISPVVAFNKDTTEQKFAPIELIEDAFLNVVFNRKIDKSGCINLNGKKYTSKELIYHVYKTVDVIYDNAENPKVWAEINDRKIELNLPTN